MKDADKILEGCKRGDRSCQELLYKQHYAALFALCRNFFSEDHDILTALNNGMLKVFKNIHQYNESRGALFNWIYTIVRNETLSYLKTKKIKRETSQLEKAEYSYALNPFKLFEWKDIYFYLDQLPVTTRTVCTLFYFEEMKITEIQKCLKMKEGTVKWHLNESRKRLRELFHIKSSKVAG